MIEWPGQSLPCWKGPVRVGREVPLVEVAPAEAAAVHRSMSDREPLAL